MKRMTGPTCDVPPENKKGFILSGGGGLGLPAKHSAVAVFPLTVGWRLSPVGYVGKTRRQKQRLSLPLSTVTGP